MFSVTDLEDALSRQQAYSAPNTREVDPKRSETQSQILLNHTYASSTRIQLTNVLSAWMSEDTQDEIDTYTGLGTTLLLIINRISDLQMPYKNKQILLHQKEVKILKATLQGLHQKVSPDIGKSHASQIFTSAEVYRLASLIFLHQKVAMIRSRVGRRISCDNLFSETEVLDLVNQIIVHFMSTPELTKTASIPLWPLFIAGCSAGDDNLRVQVLEVFDRAESRHRFGVSLQQHLLEAGINRLAWLTLFTEEYSVSSQSCREMLAIT